MLHWTDKANPPDVRLDWSPAKRPGTQLVTDKQLNAQLEHADPAPGFTARDSRPQTRSASAQSRIASDMDKVVKFDACDWDLDTPAQLKDLLQRVLKCVAGAGVPCVLKNCINSAPDSKIFETGSGAV